MLITLLLHPPIIFIQNFVILLWKKNRLQKCYFLEKASYNRNLSFTYENVLRNYRLTELLTAEQGLHEYNKKWSKELIFWKKKSMRCISNVSNVPFLYPLKTLENRKSKSFLMFSGGRERVQWEQMCYIGMYLQWLFTSVSLENFLVPVLLR